MLLLNFVVKDVVNAFNPSIKHDFRNNYYRYFSVELDIIVFNEVMLNSS